MDTHKPWCIGCRLEDVQERFIARLIEALRRNDCWCEVGIGNPMLRDHSAICKEIQERKIK